MSTPKEFFSAAKERIYWQGTVGQGKFDPPLIMKKDLALRNDKDIQKDIDSFWLLCSMPATGPRRDKFLTAKSDFGINNVASEIKKDPENIATIEFTRPLHTDSKVTMELHDDASYVLYLSWGVFTDKASFGKKEFVLGDTLQGVDIEGNAVTLPELIEFPILPAPPQKCSSASFVGAFQALVVGAMAMGASTLF